MKREVKREKKLPAFRMNYKDMEGLIDRIRSIFDTKDKLYISISIDMKTEKIEFKDLEEFVSYKFDKDITQFKIYMSQQEKSLWISKEDYLISNNKATVTATGDSIGWCTGAVETVFTYVNSYKTWYNKIMLVSNGWIALIMSWIPILCTKVMALELTNTTVVIWLILYVVIVIIYLARAKLFPAALLRTTEKSGYFREHSGEIAIVLMFLTLLTTIIMLINQLKAQ